MSARARVNACRQADRQAGRRTGEADVKRRVSSPVILPITLRMPSSSPAPHKQTFLADEKLQRAYRVDGVVTVVDAKHIMQHLESSEACEERLARNRPVESHADTGNMESKLLSVEVRLAVAFRPSDSLTL